jgi:para-nitrobenzyl esterase
MTSPLAKGLFHRAIQQSGTVVGRSRTRSLADSGEAGRKLAAKLDAPEQGAIAFLRRIPAGELQRLAFPQERAAGVSGAGAGVGPTIDGWVLTRPAWEVFAAGRQHPVPLMIGNAAQEMRSRASPDVLRRTITETYGDLAPKALALYGLAEPGSKGNDDPLYGNAGAQWGADVNYRCSIALTAEYHFMAGLTVYQYQFDRAIPGRPASEHAGELPYVFGNLLPAGFVGGPFGPDDRRISDEMQLYWTHFAKKGDPNGKGVPQWPKFDPAARGYMEFTDKGPVAGQGLRRAFCELYLENAKRQFGKAK